MIRNDELYHHGVKGQRWGIIRTKAQLGYNLSKLRAKRRNKKNAKLLKEQETIDKKEHAMAEAHRKKERMSPESLEAKKRDVLDSKSSKMLYKYKDLFTYQELNDAYNRLTLENKVKDLTKNEISKGEQRLNKAINITSKAGELISNGSKLYDNFAKVYNTFMYDPDDKDSVKLPLINGDKKNKKSKNNDKDYDNGGNKNQNDSVNSKEKKDTHNKSEDGVYTYTINDIIDSDKKKHNDEKHSKKKRKDDIIDDDIVEEFYDEVVTDLVPYGKKEEDYYKRFFGYGN